MNTILICIYFFFILMLCLGIGLYFDRSPICYFKGHKWSGVFGIRKYGIEKGYRRCMCCNDLREWDKI